MSDACKSRQNKRAKMRGNVVKLDAAQAIQLYFMYKNAVILLEISKWLGNRALVQTHIH